MRNVFDQLAKRIGKGFLEPSGPTTTDDEISPDAQHADLRHEPDPRRRAERARLGLLGRMADVPCLIETYGHAPDAAEFRACLAKHLAFWQERARKARRAQRASRVGEPLVDPFLWILSAGTPTSVLRGLELPAGAGWPAGVYVRSEVLRFGIVVASELPRDRSTLLVRLMAGGPQLAEALRELSGLPGDAHERAVALPILLRLQGALGHKPTPTREEQEYVMAVQQNIVERMENRFLDRGRSEGAIEHARAMLRRVLSWQSLTPTAEEDARIDACADLAVLDRWIDQARAAESVAEALKVPRSKAARRGSAARRKSPRSS